MSYAISKEHLERLVVDFETSPHTMRREIQECWAAARERFVEWTVFALVTDAE